LAEHSGWKQIRGDVFRPPSNIDLLSAFVGTGWQLFTLIALLIIFTLLGSFSSLLLLSLPLFHYSFSSFIFLSLFFFMIGPLHGDVYEERGEVATAFITFYSLSCGISGFCSGSYFVTYINPLTTTSSSSSSNKMKSSYQWQLVLLYSIGLLPTLVLGIFSILLSISIYYDTINAIPAQYLFKVFIIWASTSIPLHLVGTLVGRHWHKPSSSSSSSSSNSKSSNGVNKVRVNEVPRYLRHKLKYLKWIIVHLVNSFW